MMRLSGYDPMAQGSQEDHIIRAFKQLIEERFAQMKEEIKAEVHHDIAESRNAISGSYDDGFHKLTHYLQMLIEVAGKTDHKVHAEIEEAVKKLKELAYK